MNKANSYSDIGSVQDESEFQIELFDKKIDNLSPQIASRIEELKKIKLEFFETKKHIRWKKCKQQKS